MPGRDEPSPILQSKGKRRKAFIIQGFAVIPTLNGMKVFRGLPNDRARAPCALTIGNFDGVHRGHQALLARVRDAADRLGIWTRP